MPASNTMPFEGVLNCWNDEHDLPDLLLAVSRSGKTGRLLFSNPEADKTVYIKEGRFIFAESSSDDDGLGPYLLRNGEISLQDYTRVSRLVGPGKRLGALLVAEGVLGPKELVPAVVGQVRSIMLGLFRRTETWYGFKEEELSRKESITLDMPVAQLLLDGVQYIESWRRIVKGVGDLESVYRLVESSKKEWSRLELEDALEEMLSMLNEPVSVADLCTRARMPDLDACRYIWVFRTLGWIESAGMPVEEEKATSQVDEAAAVAETPPEPVMAAPNPSSTVLDVSLPPGVGPPAKPPIPQHLVQTRVTAAAKSAATTRSAGARRKPEELARTQIAIDAPPASTAKPTTPHPSQSQVRTIPAVTPPKSVPGELRHTQMYVEPLPPEKPDSAAPSTGEMMEAILDEGDGRHQDRRASPEAASSSSASTRFFDGASALEPPSQSRSGEKGRPTPPAPSKAKASPSVSDDSYDDYFPSDLQSGFDSLSLDYPAEPASGAAVTVPSVVSPDNGNATRVAFDPPSFEEMPQTFDPPPAADSEDAGGASFEDLALSDSGSSFAAEVEPAPGVLVEASGAAAVETSDDIPVVEGDVIVPEPAPPVQGGGMEIFAATDPFGSSAPPVNPSPPIGTDDPLPPSVAASLPRRRRTTQELDLDADGLGQFFGADEQH